MYAVGEIATTHTQWTVGEFTYACLRLERAVDAKDYLVTHATKESFRLYLPPMRLRLNLKGATPVPVRVIVGHSTNMSPEDMSEPGFALVARTVLRDAMKEVAVRCPRNTSCLCTMSGSGACGLLGRTEFTISGLITSL